ncbi:hypothetical protein L195_g054533 [Trifolium pratense]|uniref:Uncharacterized protein n=1 Tax=Trifolium pratense TaxID=57577 RepID=A0A2K3KGL3_TRIPR|nr:hypothetical protein L195_g054533 [Trifolium pratense]
MRTATHIDATACGSAQPTATARPSTVDRRSLISLISVRSRRSHSLISDF